MIRLGDNTVPYNDQFRLLMITKLPNPEYAPEVQVCGGFRPRRILGRCYGVVLHLVPNDICW